MNEKQPVRISEFRTGRAPSVLITYGVGSCLGVALYDPLRKVGGLAHTLLPAAPAGETCRESKYVDSAIRLMLAELLASGARKGSLEAKIAGGANMFEPLQPARSEGIGARNVRAAREVLASLGIPLRAEDVGGRHGRTIELDLASGELRVRSVCRPDTNLTL